MQHPYFVVVQSITTEWTKKTRGAPQAAHRRGIPLALSLPSLDPKSRESFCLVDRIRYGERDAFQEPFRSPLETVPPQTLVGVFYQVDDNVTIEPDEGAIKIDLRWVEGKPRRMHHIGLYTIHPGSWARMRYNYRASGEDITMYIQRTLNIAVGADLDADVFTSTDPVHTYEDIADLW